MEDGGNIVLFVSLQLHFKLQGKIHPTLNRAAVISKPCAKTVQSSFLNSIPLEVDYLVNIVASSLGSALDTEKDSLKSEELDALV